MIGDKRKTRSLGLSVKMVPQKKKNQKRKTVKEIADETVRRMKVEEEEIKLKKPRMNPGMHELNERRASLEDKIKCKYRYQSQMHPYNSKKILGNPAMRRKSLLKKRQERRKMKLILRRRHGLIRVIFILYKG